LCAYMERVRWLMFFGEEAVTDLIVTFTFETERGGFDSTSGLFSDCYCFEREKGFSGV
jgi:hypothetical protein